MGAHRFGTVALCGPANVGKSTLLNRIIGEKISIMSRRAQTTRHRILGIKTTEDAQLAFIDTPGLHYSRARGANHLANRAAHRSALNGANDADLIVFMIDSRGWNAARENQLKQVAAKNKPMMLAINKIDKLSKRELVLPLIEQSAQLHAFCQIIPLSARKAADVAAFERLIIAALPEGAPGYPPSLRTDRSLRFRAAELIREQVLKLFAEELPHSCAVEITDSDNDGVDDSVTIDATIWVEKTGQKAIVIGAGGQQLKKLGTRARLQMEKSFGVRVHLNLHVKVKNNWRDNEAMLRVLGYIEE